MKAFIYITETKKLVYIDPWMDSRYKAPFWRKGSALQETINGTNCSVSSGEEEKHLIGQAGRCRHKLWLLTNGELIAPHQLLPHKSESLDFLLCPLIWMISVKQLSLWTPAYRKSTRGINVSMVVSASPSKDIQKRVVNSPVTQRMSHPRQLG